MTRTLIAYYSRTGTTELLAKQLALGLGADLFEIKCTRYRGLFGYVRAAYDSLKRRLPPVALSDVSLDDYDLLVVAGPVWTSYGATPVRAFLSAAKGLPSRVALALTYGGHSPAESAFEDLKALLAGNPEVVMSVNAEAMNKGDAAAAMDDFIDKLKER